MPNKNLFRFWLKKKRKQRKIKIKLKHKTSKHKQKAKQNRIIKMLLAIGILCFKTSL